MALCVYFTFYWFVFFRTPMPSYLLCGFIFLQVKSLVCRVSFAKFFSMFVFFFSGFLTHIHITCMIMQYYMCYLSSRAVFSAVNSYAPYRLFHFCPLWNKSQSNSKEQVAFGCRLKIDRVVYYNFHCDSFVYMYLLLRFCTQTNVPIHTRSQCIILDDLCTLTANCSQTG